MWPKLTALQSRLLGSALALLLIIALYLSISSRTFAYAQEIDTPRSDDRIPAEYEHDDFVLTQYTLDVDLETEDEELGEEHGISVERGEEELEKRQKIWVGLGLTNNVPRLDNAPQGTVRYYQFTNESLWGKKTPAGRGLPSPGLVRARGAEDDVWVPPDNTLEGGEDTENGLAKRTNATRMVYITLNTCLQPNDPTDILGSKPPPPQLTLYVSQNNTTPGPGQPAEDQKAVQAQHGFANITIEASRDVYIAVAAPNTTDFKGIYNVEVAASIDGRYHDFVSNSADLFFIDSDSRSALLATRNLTLDGPESSIYKKWMEISPPYIVFAHNQNDSRISGVSHSYCGLEKYASITRAQIDTAMTNVTLGSFPKQQFYFEGLNASSQYYGILAMTGNSTARGDGVVGGGGAVWQTMNFSTQSDGNCAVIYGLEFCSDVNYAVPGNPSKYGTSKDLAKFYDDQAKESYDNFDKALQQIPCEIASTGQYSLARTCDDCAKAYKSWLCTTMIPRCQDYSRSDPWLQPRNIAQAFPNGTLPSPSLLGMDTGALTSLSLNSSRNPLIDTEVQPGPYKEILPCQDLCYNLVQSCPAAMGFSCPRPGMMGFEAAYGYRPNGSVGEEGMVTCNYPGAAYHLSGAKGLEPLTAFMLVVLAGVLSMLV